MSAEISSNQGQIKVHFIDEIGRAIYLYCPCDQIVLLQGYFETYEGLGIIRTIDSKNSLISIITTSDMIENCLGFLNAIKPEIAWQASDASIDFELNLSTKEKES